MPAKSTYASVVEALALGEEQEVQEGGRQEINAAMGRWYLYGGIPARKRDIYAYLSRLGDTTYMGMVGLEAKQGDGWSDEEMTAATGLTPEQADAENRAQGMFETAPHDYACQDCGKKYSGGSQDPTCPDCGSKNSSSNPKKMEDTPRFGYDSEPSTQGLEWTEALAMAVGMASTGWEVRLGNSPVGTFCVYPSQDPPPAAYRWVATVEPFGTIAVPRVAEGLRETPDEYGLDTIDQPGEYYATTKNGVVLRSATLQDGRWVSETGVVFASEEIGRSWAFWGKFSLTYEPGSPGYGWPAPAVEEKRHKGGGLAPLREAYQVNADVRKREYVKFISSGNTATVAGNVDTIPTLEAGVYGISTDMSGKAIFEKKAIRSDDILRFADSRYNEVVREIDEFWAMHENFSELGLAHKRGVLMWGNPGTGKSILVKQVVEDAVNKGCVVFYPDRLSELTQVLPQFRDVEPTRPCLVVLEDVDGMLEYGERYLLELFDGDAQISNVCYLATTNYPDRLPPRVMRSGRFDTKIEVKNPPREGRLAYFQHKLGGRISEDEIERISDITEDFSFAQLREFVVAAYAMRQEPKAAAARIRRNYTEGVSRVGQLVEVSVPVWVQEPPPDEGGEGSWYKVKKGVEVPDFTTMSRLSIFVWINQNTYSTGVSTTRPNPLQGMGSVIGFNGSSPTEEALQEEAGEVTLRDFLQARMHEAITVSADKLAQMGVVSSEERISLSGLVGDTLRAFSEGFPAGLANRLVPPEILTLLTFTEEEHPYTRTRGTEKAGSLLEDEIPIGRGACDFVFPSTEQARYLFQQLRGLLEGPPDSAWQEKHVVHVVQADLGRLFSKLGDLGILFTSLGDGKWVPAPVYTGEALLKEALLAVTFPTRVEAANAQRLLAPLTLVPGQSVGARLEGERVLFLTQDPYGMRDEVSNTLYSGGFSGFTIEVTEKQQEQQDRGTSFEALVTELAGELGEDAAGDRYGDQIRVCPVCNSAYGYDDPAQGCPNPGCRLNASPETLAKWAQQAADDEERARFARIRATSFAPMEAVLREDLLDPLPFSQVNADAFVAGQMVSFSDYHGRPATARYDVFDKTTGVSYLDVYSDRQSMQPITSEAGARTFFMHLGDTLPERAIREDADSLVHYERSRQSGSRYPLVFSACGVELFDEVGKSNGTAFVSNPLSDSITCAACRLAADADLS